ncbi:transcription initiation factor IIB family protein [Haladaptatus sp. AB643]|uniref:transcription initiation factor IIB n=1 Tax=Haladaptatus sp. AB643 TaxID=2934174 RepID=UPI00209C4C8A|nr:transcription initiation factor IIB family protein [Haladaptatus sp. AB643]MCO8242987.1 transcription initiation factor IIB family protein [Haladaptatus sp. AB643]
MATSEIYTKSFDEDSGRIISASECPECDGKLASEGGEIACEDCGLVVNEYWIDHAAERSYSHDDETNTKRTGPLLTQTRHDRGLSTEIGIGRDGKGKSLSLQKRLHLGRLRREHNRARWRSTAERNLGTACTEIARLTSALELPRSIREESCVLFRRAQDANLVRGRSIESIAAASVYVACRQNDHTLTVTDFAAVAQCPERKVTNGYRILNSELGVAIRPRLPAEFLPRFASELAVPTYVERRAHNIAKHATDAELVVGCNPAGVAAGCLAIASNDLDVTIRQIDLADVADVSAYTVRVQRNRIRDGIEDGESVA